MGHKEGVPVSTPSTNRALLITSPYATVEAVFQGYSARHDQHGGVLRGGRTRSDEVPRHAPRITRVDSSFTEEQDAYILAAITCLNGIAKGRVWPPSRATTVPSFSERIVDAFNGQPQGSASFRSAWLSAAVDVYRDFGTYHPNLIPVIEGMAKNALIEGTDQAFELTAGFLFAAKAGILTPENQKEHLKKVFEYANFVGDHTDEESDPPYEVWCSGEGFARTLIRQSQAAALRLIRDPNVRESYSEEVELSRFSVSIRDRRDFIRAEIEEVITRVKAA